MKGARWKAAALAAAAVAAGAAVRISGLGLIWTITDQTRDLARAFEIAAGSALPLLGPAVGPSEFCLGPLYYYILAVPALLFRSPLAVFLLVPLVNIAALAAFFLFVRRWLGGRVAVLSLFPYALSAPWILRAQVLSNPTLLPLFTIVFWACVMEWIVGKRAGFLAGAAAAEAVLLQLHLSTAVFIPIALLLVLVLRPPLRPSAVAAGAAGAFVLCLPYLGHEYRCGWGNTFGLLDFLCGAAAGGGPRGGSSPTCAPGSPRGRGSRASSRRGAGHGTGSF